MKNKVGQGGTRGCGLSSDFGAVVGGSDHALWRLFFVFVERFSSNSGHRDLAVESAAGVKWMIATTADPHTVVPYPCTVVSVCVKGEEREREGEGVPTGPRVMGPTAECVSLVAWRTNMRTCVPVLA